MAEQGNADDAESLLHRAYGAFNGRDIEAALALMDPEVEWPNGMEGGYVHGHGAVRDYWTRQWQLIDPTVNPQGFHEEPDGRTLVDVHQVIRDLDGKVISDQAVQHVYRLKDGLVVHMEIRPV